MTLPLQQLDKTEQRLKLAKDVKTFSCQRDVTDFDVIDERYMSSMDDLNDTLDKIARGEML